MDVNLVAVVSVAPPELFTSFRSDPGLAPWALFFAPLRGFWPALWFFRCSRYNRRRFGSSGGGLSKSGLVWLFILVFECVFCLGQREPVLKQIDLPHPYYYREMYLPQLTTGPSAVSWSPDSKSLVYSMAGSLWRQKLESTKAEQLSAGPGYDYQPDWSADRRWVVFDRYDHDAVELWVMDLRDGRMSQLTSGGAVNLEPRFSPD